MNKRVPKVFANKIDKKINNNVDVYYSSKGTITKNIEKESYIEHQNSLEKLSIITKINNIFNSPRYVYKADVNIKLNSGTVINKRIVGKNNNELITIENEKIPIESILDIEFAE